MQVVILLAGIATAPVRPHRTNRRQAARRRRGGADRYCAGILVFMTGVIMSLTWYLWQVRQSWLAALAVWQV
jgi:uncharacterized membrane protein